MDNKKVIVSSYLAASALAWFLTRSAIYYLAQKSYQIRRLPMIQGLREGVPVVVGLILFFILLKNQKVNQVMEEVVSELKKVSWPSREDVVRSTTVVIACIMIASFILATFDIFWGRIVDLLFRV